MTREEYISAATEAIEDRVAKAEVKRELEAHLDDRMQYYIDAGYDSNAALERTLSQMGDGEQVGESLGKLHNFDRIKKAANIMSITFAVIMLIFTIYLFIDFCIGYDVSGDYIYRLSEVAFFAARIAMMCWAVSFRLAQKTSDNSALFVHGLTSLLTATLGIAAVYFYSADVAELIAQVVENCTNLEISYHLATSLGRLSVIGFEIMLIISVVFDFGLFKNDNVSNGTRARMNVFSWLIIVLTVFAAAIRLFDLILIVITEYV